MLGPLASIWDPLGYLLGLRQRLGGLARFQSGPRWTFLASHPDLIHELLVTRAGCLGKARGLRMARRMLGDGLLTSEGDYHRQQRKLMLPGFAPQQVAVFGESVATMAEQLSCRWRHGSTVDCLREFNQLTLNIAGRTLFDSDFENQATLIAGMLNQGRWLFRWGFFLFPIFAWLERLPPVRHLLLQKRQRIDALVYPIIENHRRSPRANLLSNLIRAGMSDEAIRDEAVTLLLAAHETTANALAWTCYLLALHPEWQSRLGEELKLGLGGRPATVEDVSRLPLLKNVLLESMRLFPPNWMIAREAMEDFRLGDQLVPKGSTCLVSQFVLHREERWFPDAERFDPDRWLRCPRSSLPRTAYLRHRCAPLHRRALCPARERVDSGDFAAAMVAGVGSRATRPARPRHQPASATRPATSVAGPLEARLVVPQSFGSSSSIELESQSGMGGFSWTTLPE